MPIRLRVDFVPANLTMRIDLNTPVTLDSAKAALAAFWHWWTGELRALLPGPVAERLGGAFERWAIELDGAHWRLGRRGQDGPEIILDTASPPSVMHDLIKRLEPGALVRRLDVGLPASDVLLRRIRVPASAASHMRAVVKLQLDRLSPFPPEDVLFDCRKLGPESDGEIEVEVGIVPKATLDAHEEQLAAIGLVAGRFEAAGNGLMFKPTRRRWTRHEQVQAALAGVAALALIGVIVLAPILRDNELADLSAEVAALRGPALEAAAARDEIVRLQQPLRAVSARLAAPSALDTLAALTQAIPDTAQLGTLTIDGATVRFDAAASSPARTLTLLARSGRFHALHLTAKPGPLEHGLSRFAVETTSVRP